MFNTLPLHFSKITSLRTPDYLRGALDWEEWRLCYEGGIAFRDRYLERWSERETITEFEERKRITPIPTFAKAAINRVKNSVFQRCGDISRRGGSKNYQDAVDGNGYGIDGRGATMNAFIGQHVLPDLLVMGKVGVFVDAPASAPQTLADEVAGGRPYIYTYPVECIPWLVPADPNSPSDWKEVVLIDRVVQADYQKGYAITEQRYRYLWIDETTKKVNFAFLDLQGKPIGVPTELDLEAIPFVMADINCSLIQDVTRHQIFLLNMTSSDSSYALEANFPFLTRQKNMLSTGEHLEGNEGDVETGVKKGLFYEPKMERPGFISPPVDPIKLSLELRREIKNEIYELVNIAVDNLKGNDPGLDSGLSFIGLVLESAEQRIADHYAAYESTDKARQQVPAVAYPKQWAVLSDEERIANAKALTELMFKIPGRQIKRELAKLVSQTLLVGRVKTDVLDGVAKEIDSAKYCTSDPDTIQMAKENNIVDDATAAEALGFDPEVVKKAQEERATKAAEVVAAQTAAGGGGFGGRPRFGPRGAPEADPDPKAADDEKKVTQANPFGAPKTRGDEKPASGEGK